jgi:hypothetical protein
MSAGVLASPSASVYELAEAATPANTSNAALPTATAAALTMRRP